MKIWKPTVAGILTLVSGGYGISFGAALRQGPPFLDQFLSRIWIGGMPANTGGDTAGDLAFYGTLYTVFGIIALLGGVLALRRRVWGLALAGAILTLWMIPFGSVMGILAIVFLARSKGEFGSHG